jgi:hypothetical protein
VDRREGGAHIDLAVHRGQCVHGSRACGVAHVVRKPCLGRVVVGEGRCERLRQEFPGKLFRPPQPIPALPVGDHLGILVLVRHGPRIVRRVVPARAGAEQDQRDRALGVGRGEQHGHRTAFRHAENDRTLGADGVHHSAGIVHPDLERREPILGDPVGEPDASLVEQHDAGERGEAFVEPREPGLGPHLLDVRDPSEHEQDVDRAVADDLIGDMDAVGGLCIAGLGYGHASILVRAVAGRNPWSNSYPTVIVPRMPYA